MRNNQLRSRILDRTHRPLAAESLGFLQRIFDVRHTHIEYRVGLVRGAAADTTRNANSLGRRIAIDEAVVTGLGDFLRYWSVGVGFPFEEFGKEGTKSRRVPANNLEVHYWISHTLPPRRYFVELAEALKAHGARPAGLTSTF